MPSFQELKEKRCIGEQLKDKLLPAVNKEIDKFSRALELASKVPDEHKKVLIDHLSELGKIKVKIEQLNRTWGGNSDIHSAGLEKIYKELKNVIGDKKFDLIDQDRLSKDLDNYSEAGVRININP